MEPIDPNRHQKANDAVNSGQPVDADYVRTGGKGKSVLPILIISLALAVVVLVVALVVFNSSSEDLEPSLQEKAAEVNAPV